MDKTTKEQFDKWEDEINKNAPSRIENKDCGNCKFKAQGPTCCFCNHPKQTDKKLKGYVYYTFSCDLFEHLHFEKMTDQEKIALGYTKGTYKWGYKEYPCWNPPIVKK